MKLVRVYCVPLLLGLIVGAVVGGVWTGVAAYGVDRVEAAEAAYAAGTLVGVLAFGVGAAAGYWLVTRRLALPRLMRRTLFVGWLVSGLALPTAPVAWFAYALASTTLVWWSVRRPGRQEGAFKVGVVVSLVIGALSAAGVAGGVAGVVLAVVSATAVWALRRRLREEAAAL